MAFASQSQLRNINRLLQTKLAQQGYQGSFLPRLEDFIELTDSSSTDEQNVQKIINAFSQQFGTAPAPIPPSPVAPAPAQTTPFPAVVGQSPNVFGMLPEQEQRALGESAELEQAERRKGIDEYLMAEEAALPAYTAKARDVFLPSFERSIKRGAELLGGQGLGSGGFGGSGAIQELVRKGAQELEESVSIPAIQAFGEAGRQARVFGLDTSQVPTAYRRAALQRGFEKSDIEKEREFQEKLARLTGAYYGQAAKAGRSSIPELILGGLASSIPVFGKFGKKF